MGRTHKTPWLPTLVRTEPEEAEWRNRIMNRKENTIVHVEQKSRKRVRSRTVVDKKLWCELKRAVSHAEIAS